MLMEYDYVRLPFVAIGDGQGVCFAWRPVGYFAC
jgi:hypothetical protein